MITTVAGSLKRDFPFFQIEYGEKVEMKMPTNLFQNNRGRVAGRLELLTPPRPLDTVQRVPFENS